MGRAYAVRKASIEKTGAAKGKLFTNYAKEIYQSAKTHGVNTDTNASLKRILERAKKDQIPADIIKRAIDKVNSGVDESYSKNTYEFFGPGGSTIITECLTDNVNRTVSDLRTVVNKTHIKMGALGSVSFNYDHLCIVSFKGLDEYQTMDALLNKDIEVIDIEEENDNIIIYGNPQDLFNIKETISEIVKDVEFDMDEITLLPKEKVTLSEEDTTLFNKVISMLEECEDVSNVYHNVEI